MTVTDIPDLRVALVQLAVEDGHPDRNMDRALGLIGEAPPAHVYLLPELWTTGYAHDCWERTADRHTPRAVETLAECAADRGAWIGGSLVTRNEAGRLVNRFWMLAPDGEDAAAYDKGHLFGPMGEEERLEAGERRIRIPIGRWTVALSLCYDLRFPEMYRLDAVDGAELFLVPSEWPSERKDLLTLFARSRAAENQSYLALCNRVGPGRDGTQFEGGSMLVGPGGDVLARAGPDETVIVGTAERDRVREIRERIPVLDRRRPGLDATREG